MFMVLNPNKIKNQFAAYSLTDADGNLLFVGVARATDVLCFPGATIATLPDRVNLLVQQPRDDLMTAANDALGMAGERRDLIAGLKKMVDNFKRPPQRAGCPVECVETGERFFSMTAAMKAHGLSYSALHNHLNGLVGYKTVKGRRYKKLK